MIEFLQEICIISISHTGIACMCAKNDTAKLCVCDLSDTLSTVCFFLNVVFFSGRFSYPRELLGTRKLWRNSTCVDKNRGERTKCAGCLTPVQNFSGTSYATFRRKQSETRFYSKHTRSVGC